MKVAIDVDGVLADHVPAVLSLIRRENPDFSMTKADIQTWDEALPSISSDMKKEVMEAESDPEFIKSMPPVEGAIEATNQLASEGHEIIIVTSRPESLLPATHEWLKAHEIPHRREESLSTNGVSKSIADAEVLIDDFPGNLHEFRNGRFGILFEQPWNSDYKDEFHGDDQSYVAASWDEVLQIVERIQAR